MKFIRFSAVLTAILLALLLLAACTGGDDPADTTAATTAPAVTEAPTAEPTEEATTAPETLPESTQPETEPETTAPETQPVTEPETTQSETQAETEPETAAPVELTADELKALLSAAMEKDMENSSTTIQAAMNGEIYSDMSTSQIGEDFVVETRSEGFIERIVAVGDKVYYFASVSDGVSETVMRYVMTPTAEEREELFGYYNGGSSPVGGENEWLIEELVNSTFSGVKYADGTVEMSCTDVSNSLVEDLFGEYIEGAALSFDFILDGEGRMTLMRFTITLSAEATGSEAMTVYSEIVVNYTPDPITAPDDAASYAETTYDELFGVQLPEPDFDEATSVGLPLDGDNYTIGGEEPAHDPMEQYVFLCMYAHCYEDKTFTLYGNVMEDEEGNLILSLGEDMEFPIYFDGAVEPTVGSYVKVTAVYTKTVDMGDYADFDCFTMMVTACEVLGEAVGPNGGKLMYITASSLNVRTSSDTSTSDNIIGTYSKGDLVEVFEQDEKGWYRVVYNGQDAYISNNYVSETKP